MTTRAYVRESTVAQGDKFGPDAQRAAIERACDELGIGRPTHWYTDLVSGMGKVVRDELQAAIAAAAAHEYTTLVCYDTSRFARRERDAFNFEAALAQAGVRIFYAAERIWADDDSKALHKGMLHVINAEYSRSLSRRIRDGYAQKIAKGGHVGAVPTGYARTPDTMSIVPVDVTARLLAWSLYATGEHTYATVAAELTRRGHRITWHGASRVYTAHTVAEILSRDIDLRFGGLDPVTYERARDVARRHRINEHVGQRRHAYVFAGLARCAECGESMWGRVSKSRRQLYHAPRGCRRGARYEEVLEVQVGRWLASLRLPKDAPAKVARYLAARRDAPDVVAQRRGLEAELERVRNLYRWADIGEAEYQRERARLVAQIAALGPETIARPVSMDAVRMVERVGEAWMAAGEQARRTFALALFSELRLHRDGSLSIVPAPTVRELVYASLGSAPWAVLVQSPRSQPPATATHPASRDRTVRVVGYEDWATYWANEAAG